MERNISFNLKNWKENKKRKPLILLGARQVGKTYLLKNFGKENFSKYLYVNFEEKKELCKLFTEDLDPKRILSELEIYFNAEIDLKNDLIILDEIQECPEAISSLKYFSEVIPELATCSAGSLLGVKLGMGSFPVGKVELVNMFPMSFFEFLKAINELKLLKYLLNWNPSEKFSSTVHSKAWDLFKTYLVVGGLPESILVYKEHQANKNKALAEVRKSQQNLIKTHLADIAKHSGKQNSMHIERIWSNIPSQLAREQDGTATKFKFKGVIPNVKGYSRLADTIDWLQAAGLILRIPISNSGNLPLKAFTDENSFKLYLYDVGILGALSSLEPSVILNYDYGTYKGYFAENFIAQEFTCAMGQPDEIFAWKKAKSEIEFLRVVKDSVIPIEVKSGWNTRSRSINVFIEKYNPPYGIIFSAGNFIQNEKNKIRRLPLYLASRFPSD